MRFYLIVILLLLSSLLISVTYTVKQDGTGDYTIIQTAVDIASSGDTIRVYPGRYYENIEVTKNIAIVSNYEYTQDENEIANTILDGNQTGSVLAFLGTSDNQMNNYLCGFIITNGAGFLGSSNETLGGGLYLDYVNLTLKKCIIQNNKAKLAGGIFLYNDVQLNLIGNTIRYNRSLKAGGGILISNSNVTFDNEMLNNIYLNYAGQGSDIFISHLTPFQEIIVDTFTVMNPNEGYYYIYPASDYAGTPYPNHFSIDIRHSKIEQVNGDLYVSTQGDNNNSGLTPEESLKSIAFALTKIHSDSLNPKIIHVADGRYSSSLTGEYLPLHIKSYVSIVGESRENTILDAEFYGGYIFAFDPQKNYTVKNFTFLNAGLVRCINITENLNVNFDNILITQENENTDANNFMIISLTDFSLNNVIVKDSHGGLLDVYTAAISGNSVLNIINCIFENNLTGSTYRAISIARSFSVSDSLVVNLINSEIVNNLDQSSGDWLPTSVAISLIDDCKINIINSTISGNETEQSQGAAISLKATSTANIVNSILYGDSPREIFLDGREGPTELNVKNSLIQGGMWNVGQYGNNEIDWDEESTTLDDADPLFVNSGDYPFQLSEFSPCIDAGTMDLPEGIELPETDLAGNPRVVNGVVDIGAYEYQGASTHQNEIPKPVVSSLNVYPNPFMINSPRKTELKFELKLIKDGNIRLEIYNVKGQKVKTIMDAFASQGKYLSKWDGKNNQNKFIATGTYFARFILNDKVMQIRKFIVVK